MSHYRLYCLDGAGKITHADWIEADGDHEAVRMAVDMQKPVACELWQRARFIASIAGYEHPGNEMQASPTLPAA